MTKKIIVLLASLILLLTACSSGNNKRFAEKIDAGKEAVTEEEYPKAEQYFKDALNIKKNDQKATLYLGEVKDFQKAQILMKKGEFKKAKKIFEVLIRDKSDLKELQDRSRTAVEKIDAQLDEKEKYEKIYAEALALNEKGNYKASNEKLTAFLNEDVEDSYFDGLRKKAEKLKVKNDRMLKEMNDKKINEANQKKTEEEKKASENNGTVKKQQEKNNGNKSTTPKKNNDNKQGANNQGTDQAQQKQAQNRQAIETLGAEEKAAIDLVIQKLGINPAFYNFAIRDEGNSLYISLIEDHVASGEGDPEIYPTVDSFKYDKTAKKLYRITLEGVYEPL